MYCPVRKAWVAAFPEEVIRQRMILHMIEEKGFPPSLVAVEKSLKELSTLTASVASSIPNRRVDLVCYFKKEDGLYPLILVECKATPLTSRVMHQILGYNHYVHAAFISIVNQTEVRTGWFDSINEKYIFINYLPTYKELISRF